MLSDSGSMGAIYNSVNRITDTNVKYLLLMDMQILFCPAEVQVTSLPHFGRG